MLYPAQHISIGIDAEPAKVTKFAGNPANLPQWAAGLSTGIRQEGGKWITNSPMGVVEVRFTGPQKNDVPEHGILDHDVILPDGTTGHNPLRVLANGTGSEVIFTLYRLPGTSDADLERDADMVREDLARLKQLLEEQA
ncbi:SRPBCC family protein [Neomicrococcus lactis]|uniref:SRPBCC family protein n=1 Tax=Neomicrococcus lactis TaxID=732241 RepID=UPI002301F16F|nr:SRPBCC family protein [Neomicrococcus lactis]